MVALHFGQEPLRYPDTPLEIVEFDLIEDVSASTPPSPAPSNLSLAEQEYPDPQAEFLSHQIKQSAPTPHLVTNREARKKVLSGLPYPLPAAIRPPLAAYAAQVRDKIAEHKFYPEEARRSLIEGRVLLEVQVFPDGSLGKVSVVRSSGFRILDRAAQLAAETASPFEPPPASWTRQVRLHIPVRYFIELS